MSTVIPSPSPTPLPQPHEKRHYYTCGGQLLTWEPEWYTQAWFTAERSSYDVPASTGPVNPPFVKIGAEQSCIAALSASVQREASMSAMLSAGGRLETVTTRELGTTISGPSAYKTTVRTVFTTVLAATNF